MDPRYAHPEITRLFDKRRTYALWARILGDLADAQAEHDIIPGSAGLAITMHAREIDSVLDEPESLPKIGLIEQSTRHDVAAFLYWWESIISTNEDQWGRYLAYGLTSSDLADTALGLKFKASNDVVWENAMQLMQLMERGVEATMDCPFIARTHGQPAEPTALGLVINTWLTTTARIFRHLDAAWMECAVGKLSGPVGTYAYQPPHVVNPVLRNLGLDVSDEAMQIVPRDRIARWAATTAQAADWIAKIGLDFRLMASRGVVSEGYSADRVGSSSMPHKVNPVEAEKLAGLARLAAGYASMLQTAQTWEQRDISHSSVERVAIPDLMHALIHAIETLCNVLENAQWEHLQMAPEGPRSPHSAWAALRAVDAGCTRRQAREVARRWVSGLVLDTDPHIPDPPGLAWFVRQHPLTPILTD